MLLNALGWVIYGRNDMAVLNVNCPDLFDIDEVEFMHKVQFTLCFIVRFLL